MCCHACRRRQRRLEKGLAAKAAAEPPVTAELPLTALGVSSEAFQDALAAFLRTDPERDLAAAAATPDQALADAAGSPGKKVPGLSASLLLLLKRKQRWPAGGGSGIRYRAQRVWRAWYSCNTSAAATCYLVPGGYRNHVKQATLHCCIGQLRPSRPAP